MNKNYIYFNERNESQLKRKINILNVVYNISI